ncbi:MAG: hypothetical protein ACKVP4_11130 [Hyphomicrobium sp.]
MTAALLKSSSVDGLPRALARATPRAWWVIAMTAISFLTMIKGADRLTVTLGDADDAARLLQIREFMAGAPWFDLTTFRMGGDAGMLSHWSRLIDLPIAALIYAFGLFLPTATAELVVRAIWPLIVLAPMVWVMISAAHRDGGATAAAIATLLTLLCPLGLYQFVAGRIDHHGVMISATVAASLLIASRSTEQRIWRVAGALCAFALAIGYEALAPVAIIAGSIAVWGLYDATVAPTARTFTLAFIATFAALFAVTTAPSRWLVIHCDAISLNMVALAVSSGGGLVFALDRGATLPIAWRLTAFGAAGLMGLALFAAMEPKCLAGPMGQLPPELATVWLSVVDESKSIVGYLIKGNFEQSLALLAYFALSVAAAAIRVRDSRAAADVFLLAIVVGFTLLAFWQYKYIAYASLLGVVPIALAVARLDRIGDVSAATIRFGAAVAISQAALLAASDKVQATVGVRQPITKTMHANAQACSDTTSLADLAELQPGLIVAHIDMGAFVPAVTPHRTLSAPYHRIPEAILATHHILESRDDAEAQALLAREKVDYIVLCDGLDGLYAASPERQGTLRVRLLAGTAPSFLAPVPLANASSMYKVWKFERSPLNPRP